MALQKRLEYGFNGYRVPPTPRAARSVRRRSLSKRKFDDQQQMCAFDLLATVAGKLLDGGGCPPPPPPPAVKDHPVIDKDTNKASEEDHSDQDRVQRNFLITEIVSKAPDPNACCPQNDIISRPVSGITTSDCSQKEQMANDNCKLSLGIFTPPVTDVESPHFQFSINCKLEDENKMDSPNNTRNLSVGNKALLLSSSGHREVWEKKPSPLVSSVDNFKFPVSKSHGPCGSFPVNLDNNVMLGNRDDDGNSSECTEPSARIIKASKPSSQVEDHKFRKFLASKHCKVASEEKGDECYSVDSAPCDNLHRKDASKRPRPMKDYPFKKRKIFEYNSIPNSDEGTSNGGNGIYRVPESVANESRLSSGPLRPRAIPAPPTPGVYASLQTRNAQVKLKIKTFRVPELLIEVPETATIGSLKRTVADAVTSVLGGGLRVGVHFQGKKIRDDAKTLLQTGICHDNKIDALGFTLEPSPPPAPMHLFPQAHHDRILCENPQPLARYPPTPSISSRQQGNVDAPPPDLSGTSLNNFIESDHDSAPSPPTLCLPLHKSDHESKALVPVPAVKQEPLAVVPLRKSKRSESAQRRIRRPFTVAEVEALVQAVEKLGTGRWRDVKLRAFDSAKHRTYVDLKDKWKTLVHTARISPQQRRGEPVPQELLDRVLTAHAYWSQQQAKQQVKSHPDTCLLL
ncbi:telomere repeat-binding protein 2-like [Andrographis paniculata]|uniref:telomere repeat-binding protein 2-like n=1 Tax=Andrographis paniculata TaxID=175694 RepID=UPI0021E949D2|nr:telomere repeat-binding protein 2-like [Andrographis paniculata]